MASQPSKKRSAARPSTDTESVPPGGTSAAYQAAGASTVAAAPHAGVLPADPSVVCPAMTAPSTSATADSQRSGARVPSGRTSMP